MEKKCESEEWIESGRLERIGKIRCESGSFDFVEVVEERER